MDWITGIQNAIDYMEAHITEELDYEEIAKQSAANSPVIWKTNCTAERYRNGFPHPDMKILFQRNSQFSGNLCRSIILCTVNNYLTLRITVDQTNKLLCVAYGPYNANSQFFHFIFPAFCYCFAISF